MKAFPAFPTIKHKTSTYSKDFVVRVGPNSIVDAVQLCVQVQQTSFCLAIFVRMWNSSNAAEVREWLIVLLALMERLRCVSEPTLTGHLDLFFEMPAAAGVVQEGNSFARGFEDLGTCCNRATVGRLPLLKKW